MAAFTPKKVSKVKAFDADSSFFIEGMDNGSFAIASSKKELKQLMKSDADVVYYEKKGKLYLNENGEEKGWGAKKVGGLIAKFKSKPELSADHFDGLSAHSDAVTGSGSNGQGDTKDQIASYRATLTDSEEAALLVDFTLEPKKALKRVIKDGKKTAIYLIATNLQES